MKHRASVVVLALQALLASACGGNYSNEDLEFLNAFPTRAELQAKVPETGTSTGALGTRRDGLAVGDESATYRDTRDASRKFNAGLEGFLALIEAVRKQPPTSRELDRRVWGPFPSKEHPGWNVQVVMIRAGNQFQWSIELRERGAASNDPWLVAATGDFLATSGVRKGQGAMHLFADRVRAAGLAAADDDGMLAQLDVTYVTDAYPLSVDMQLRLTPAASVRSIDYHYREFEKDRGAIWFRLEKVGGPVLLVRSAWNPDGAGRALIDYEQSGTISPGGEECWDSSQRVVYFNHPWVFFGAKSGGVRESCATVEGLQ